MAVPDDENWSEEAESKRPGPIAILLLALLIAAMLATLIWPLLRARQFEPSPPTPTPFFLKQAGNVTSF